MYVHTVNLPIRTCTSKSDKSMVKRDLNKKEKFSTL